MKYIKLICLCLILTSCGGTSSSTQSIDPSVQPSISPSVAPSIDPSVETSPVVEEIEIKVLSNLYDVTSKICDLLNEDNSIYHYLVCTVSNEEDADIVSTSILQYSGSPILDDSLKSYVLEKTNQDVLDAVINSDGKLKGIPYTPYVNVMYLDPDNLASFDNMDTIKEEVASHDGAHINIRSDYIALYLMDSERVNNDFFYNESGIYKSALALEENNDLLIDFNNYFKDSIFINNSSKLLKNEYCVAVTSPSYYSILDTFDFNVVTTKLPSVTVNGTTYHHSSLYNLSYVTKGNNCSIEEDALNNVLKAFLSNEIQDYLVASEFKNFSLLNSSYHQENTAEVVKRVDFNLSDYKFISPKMDNSANYDAFTYFLGSLGGLIRNNHDTTDLYLKVNDILEEINSLF